MTVGPAELPAPTGVDLSPHLSPLLRPPARRSRVASVSTHPSTPGLRTNVFGERPFGRRGSVAFLAALLLPLAAQGREGPFHLEGSCLTVRTAAIELVIEDGGVVLLRDRRTGETFAQCEPWPALRQVPSGASSADDWGTFIRAWRAGSTHYADDAKAQAARRRPGQGWQCRFKPAGRSEAELVCQEPAGSELRYLVRADRRTGEIVLRASARLASTPLSLDVPILGLAGQAVILGNGARYTRDDPPEVDFCMRWANNLYSPRFAVVEGKHGCLAVWTEDYSGVGNLYLAHGKATDHLILHGGRDPRERDASAMASLSWRIGVFPDWAAAARRYRQLFEEATGAVPLWENRCRWVRSVHAVSTSVPSPAEAEVYYRRLAELIPPARLLLFYWNGGDILLFGDHRYKDKARRPSPEAVAALQKQGFRWMGYHPYVLIYSPKGTEARLKELASRGELPEGYAFAPDYGGPPERFHGHFRPVSTGYYRKLDEAELWVVHPGSREGREYLARNFGSYCKAHGMSGAYMDILGGDHSYQFPPEKQVLGGLTFPMGEAQALREMRRRHPDLAVMSEIESEWTVAHTFYTWEGATHFELPRRHASIRTKVNHPLRTALWGSYAWTQDQELDPAESALIGALPPLVAGDDWSVARARLFADEELFNDLPPGRWPPEALACYRGRGGKRFEFRKLPFGDAFVEATPSGHKLRLGRFIGQSWGCAARPAQVQDWAAYRDGMPIGLNPDRVYPFLLETPRPEGWLWITSLPEGAFINAVRHSKGYSVVELDAPADRQGTGRVTVVLHRRCLRVCEPQWETEGPFEAGIEATLTTKIPGGLVFVWEEPAVADGRFRSDFKGASGHLLARGVADRFWCYNAAIRCMAAQVGGRELRAVSIGPGRHRGYADQWLRLAAGASPVLKFDVGYPVPQEKNRPTLPPLAFSVRVNGQRVWSEEAKPQPDWRPREVPLQRWAGRTVLVTLSVQAIGNRDTHPSHTDLPGLFGRVRVDNNPHSLDPPEGAALPKPKRILLADSFKGPELDKAWSVHVSAARIAVEGGMVCFEGEHYKHALIARPLSEANLTAQVRLRVGRSGCETGWNPGLGLYWGKGRHCFLTAGGYRGGDETFVIRGCGAGRIPLGTRTAAVGDDNRYDLWLRIALSEKSIAYCSSLDGKAWHVEAEFPRPKDYAAPPRLLILGRGGDGPADGFQNDERWTTGVTKAYMGELVVGQE